jgi:hypothetical protein
MMLKLLLPPLVSSALQSAEVITAEERDGKPYVVAELAAGYKLYLECPSPEKAFQVLDFCYTHFANRELVDHIEPAVRYVRGLLRR